MSNSARSPAELREMFGINLRKLAEEHASVSALARDLGINRTQFNRYLSGESFPRPDVLGRICAFFDVDARILLEPVEQITTAHSPMFTGRMAEFMGGAVQHVSEDMLPTGFYQFSRRSFVQNAQFVRGLVYVHRIDDNTFVRGFEPRDAMAMQGIPPKVSAREYCGFVMRLDDGVAVTVCRRNGLTASFNFLNRVTSFENNFWVGYVARTATETPATTRMTRLVYEYLGRKLSVALPVARTAGFCQLEDLLPFHQRLLQPDAPIR